MIRAFVFGDLGGVWLADVAASAAGDGGGAAFLAGVARSSADAPPAGEGGGTIVFPTGDNGSFAKDNALLSVWPITSVSLSSGASLDSISCKALKS